MALASLVAAPCIASAHDLATGELHGHYDWSVQPLETIAPEWFFAQAGSGAGRPPSRAAAPAMPAPAQAKVFALFAPRVSVRWDEHFLFVESNGLPAHPMMVGITNWQQQVPLPQNYSGNNAWRIPLNPVPAAAPVSIKGRFLRGAIALAANGIPIFNPQNNRGEISAEIGELDQWGGHCGRADDYHYHAAPLHLQSVVGKDQPIAYALDGYPIYGLTEPDGSPPAGLDEFNGHTTAALGYHYHASTKYPYINGGFHGEVVEKDGQVDPQPRAQSQRPATGPLHGAKITGFDTDGHRSTLTYEFNGEKRAVVYELNTDGTALFEYRNGSDGTTKQTYTPRQRASGDGNPPPDNPPRREDRGAGTDNRPRETATSSVPSNPLQKPNGIFALTSHEVTDGGNLPIDYTGDGSGATLPLAWKGAPTGTQSFALIMDHLAPDNVMKSYWVVWDIPATVTSLPKNVKDVGKVGISFKRQLGYEPPHSQGPGPKTYVLTIYALSAPVQITQSPREVTREILLAAMKDKVLASSSLHVVYTRGGNTPPERRPAGPGGPPPP
jgi:hypothetical protein